MPDADPRLYSVVGATLFVVGLYSLIVQRHLLRRIMALNVMGSGVFLVFLALAAKIPGPFPDPVPHAMVLTGIVVAVCATGLALALADRVQAIGNDTTDHQDHPAEDRATMAPQETPGSPVTDPRQQQADAAADQRARP